MARKKEENNFFHMFIQMAETAQKAAQQLQAMLGDFSTESLPKAMEELHATESQGDTCKHHLLEKLAKEFIAPIEREDILILSGALDDVIDTIEDILLCIYMYNIQEVNEEARKFTELIARSANVLLDIMKEFENFRKSKTIHAKIIEMNGLEEEGDNLYIASMRKLHTSQADAHAMLSWTAVYNTMEDCLDTCEHIADAVESVIMKNT